MDTSNNNVRVTHDVDVSGIRVITEEPLTHIQDQPLDEGVQVHSVGEGAPAQAINEGVQVMDEGVRAPAPAQIRVRPIARTSQSPPARPSQSPAARPLIQARNQNPAQPQNQAQAAPLLVNANTNTNEPAPRRAALPQTNNWLADEAKFCRDHERNGSIAVYMPIQSDRLRSQAEMLANASAEGADYIRDLHGMLFSGDIGMLDRAYRAIGLDSMAVRNMDKMAIDGEFQTKIMNTEMAMSSIILDPGFNQEHKPELLGAVRAITTMLIKLNNLLLVLNEAQATSAAAVSGVLTSDAEASWRYMTSNGDETANAVQRLYKIAFERAHMLKYARYKDGMMKRIITKEGYITNAWERVCTFQDFVYNLTSEPTGEIQFLATKTVSVMEHVAELLGKKREVEVPWLKPDRRVFAFRNGCYMAKDEHFITFSKEAPPTMVNGRPCPTACRYHDAPVDMRWIDCQDPMDIPTPLMSKIMNTQELSPDVMRVYFSMLGRAIYDLGEMDNWQVFLFIKGQAETGKSTLLKFVSSFYSPEDVGILANNIESTFGASMIAEKFIVVGDDLGENFKLDQQLFQNMSSGNEVSLPRKNKSTLITKWITQLLLSGNVLPDYRDNSGSFSRRLLIIHYAKPVNHVDPTIPERLKGEMGAAIIKCNRCYRNMVRRLSWLLTREENPLTFWDAVPEEFRIQKRNVMQCQNSVMSFLNSGTLAYGPSLYVTRELFVTQLMNHCQINGIPKPKFQPAQYEGAFVAMGIEMTPGKQKLNYHGKDMVTFWVLGCDLATSEAIAASSADSVRAAEQAVQAYIQNPDDAARIAAESMRFARKRPLSGLDSNPAPASQRPRLV